MLSAQERAHTEPELAQALILLAVKRDPAALEVLLADEALLAALPNGLGLRAPQRGGQIRSSLLQAYGVEVFLVVLARALAARQPMLFTPEAVEQLWTLAAAGGANGSAASAERDAQRPEFRRGGLAADVWRWRRCSNSRCATGATISPIRSPIKTSGRDDFLTVLIDAITEQWAQQLGRAGADRSTACRRRPDSADNGRSFTSACWRNGTGATRQSR